MKKVKHADNQVFGQPKHEILQVAEAVSREKGIAKEDVILALEAAIQKIAMTRYGVDNDIRVQIDRENGAVYITRCLTVVDSDSDNLHEISLERAQLIDPTVTIGTVLKEELPPVELGRVAAQMARGVIVSRVRDAERQRQYVEFKDRINQIVSGVVKRIEFGNMIIDIGGRAEAILRREDSIPREIFQVGDRVRSMVLDVNVEARGPMISLSRTHPVFMAKLFEQEVPEIYDSVIEIKAVARDPGSRAKIAVFSSDPSIDPIGACVGMRGSRVQVIVNELHGEKVDIIPWSSNPATFVVNSLAPAEVIKVVVDEGTHRVDAVVSEDQLSLAIGRRGQNVRLASQLTGWNIDILTEAQEAEKRAEEYNTTVKLFMDALDVDEIIAQLLTAEGFGKIEEIAEASSHEIEQIQGFDTDVAQELQTRAKEYLKKINDELLMMVRQKGLDAQLEELDGMTPQLMIILTENDILNLDDFAGLSGDELHEMVSGNMLSIDQANDLIMKARSHWFADDEG